MKKTLLFKSIAFGLFMLFGVGVLNAQVTLPHYEGFDYTAGQALTVQAGYSVNSSSTDDILIASGNLSITGLEASTGNKISFAGGGTDLGKAFTTQTSGTVFYSFIMNVTDLGALNAVGGYFAGFAQNTTTFGATIWTGLDGSGYKIGINPRTSTSTNMVWVSGTQTLDNSVFVVVSYEFVVGASNDIVNIWVNPSSSDFGSSTFPSASATVTNLTGTDLTSAVQFFIRQDSDTETPAMEMDELRVGTSWADVTPTAAASTEEVDWCNLQWPGTGTIDAGGTFDVYAQAWEAGVTDAAGQGAGLAAWIGVSTTDTDPSTWTTWISATYNGDSGNNDEYKAEIGSALSAGTYYYASKFQLNNSSFTYGGFVDGAGNFWDGTTNVSGVLTVNAVVGTDATLSALTYNGTTVAGFDAATLSYDVVLASGTTIVPTVVGTPTDVNATAVTTDATALPGSSTVLVTAENATTTETYTINFTVAAPLPSLPHYEGFDYAAGEALGAQANWINLNSGPAEVVVTSGSLTYSGLPTSVGNSVSFNGGGFDPYLTFEAATSGSVFASFIFKVTDQSAITDLTDGGYFAAIADETFSYDARIWVRPNPDATSTTFDIEFGNMSTLPPVTTNTYNVGDVIFAVISYNIDNGDVATWINPSSDDFGGTAPTATLTGNDATPALSINKFFIRQDSDGETPFMEFDELRLGTTWEEVTPTTSTGITDLSNTELSIYPNPSHGKFFVQMGDAFKANSKIEVFNVVGMKVLETMIYADKTEIDLSSMKQGVYYVRVDNGENIITQKIMKQ